MTQDFDIFSNASPQSGEFFKFKNVGDAVQGTYIDVRNGTDTFGNQQTIYVIQDKDGKVWNLAFRQTAMVIHERMNGIRFGQIVGFKFDEERESKRNPGTKVKIIRIYADPKFVDNEWLQHQKELEKNFSAPSATPSPTNRPTSNMSQDDDAFDEEEDFKVPADAGAAAGSFPNTPADEVETAEEEEPKNEAVEAIRNLAKTKGLTNESMTRAEADRVIEQYTELSLTEENLTKIIIKLTGYVSK